jgi:hypothetical protein
MLEKIASNRWYTGWNSEYKSWRKLERRLRDLVRRMRNGVTRIVMKDRVSEDSTHDFQPDIVLLAHTNKTFHHGFVILSSGSLYRREWN